VALLTARRPATQWLAPREARRPKEKLPGVRGTSNQAAACCAASTRLEHFDTSWKPLAFAAAMGTTAIRCRRTSKRCAPTRKRCESSLCDGVEVSVNAAWQHDAARGYTLKDHDVRRSGIAAGGEV